MSLEDVGEVLFGGFLIGILLIFTAGLGSYVSEENSREKLCTNNGGTYIAKQCIDNSVVYDLDNPTD